MTAAQPQLYCGVDGCEFDVTHRPFHAAGQVPLPLRDPDEPDGVPYRLHAEVRAIAAQLDVIAANLARVLELVERQDLSK